MISIFDALNISNFIVLSNQFKFKILSQYLSQRIAIIANQVTNHFQKQNF